MPLTGEPGEVWFLTGSQALYGDDVLAQVAAQSQEVCRMLGANLGGDVRLVWRPVLTTAEAIRRTCLDATADDAVIGVITWMHTFSPAKAWIAGLTALGKPLLHLHTQANRSLPWSELDMDFMNLNQAAHGDREFGYVQTRLRVARKTVAGYAGDPGVAERVDAWIRAASGWRAAHRFRPELGGRPRGTGRLRRYGRHRAGRDRRPDRPPVAGYATALEQRVPPAGTAALTAGRLHLSAADSS